MPSAGFGTKDTDGTFGFKATSDGKVVVGNTSDDVLQITGSVEQEGTTFQISGDDARIKINGDTNSHPGLEFYENSTRKWIIFNNYGDDSLDFKTNSNTRMVINQDGTVGIGTQSPSTTLDVDGTTKSTQYVTAVGTQDLGSGTSSTLSISAGVMILDADSITGQPDAHTGIPVHTLSLPSGTTNGQRITLIVNTTFGSADNVIIMPNPSNIGGAFGALVADSKTSVEFIWYGSHWFPVQ